MTKKPKTDSLTEAERAAHDFRLQEMPGYLLRRLDSQAMTVFESFTEQSELTPRQFGVLLTLFQNAPLMMTELGNKLHLDRSTLGEMVQRMVDRGLIARKPLERDRRAVEVVLTPTGRDALLATVQQALAAQEALLAPLPAYLRPVFLKCLSLLADAQPSNRGGKP